MALIADDATGNHGGFQRTLIGALGGVAAVAVKYLSQDHASVIKFIEAYNQGAVPGGAIWPLAIGYMILAPITLFLGAAIGWISGEQNRAKLFALGVSAPALLTTWSSAPDATRTAAIWNPVQHAHAQAFRGSAEPLYVVELGAFPDEPPAEQLAKRVNNGDWQSRAFVFESEDPAIADRYRVHVVRLLSIKEALSLRERMTQFSNRAVIVEVPRAGGN